MATESLTKTSGKQPAKLARKRGLAVKPGVAIGAPGKVAVPKRGVVVKAAVVDLAMGKLVAALVDPMVLRHEAKGDAVPVALMVPADVAPVDLVE